MPRARRRRAARRARSPANSRARIHALVAALADLRMHVEACIDFPKRRSIPPIARRSARKLAACARAWTRCSREARQGAVLREGLTVVLVGPPERRQVEPPQSARGRRPCDRHADRRNHARFRARHDRASRACRSISSIRRACARRRDEVERIGIERAWKRGRVGRRGALHRAESEGAPQPDAEACCAPARRTSRWRG